MFTLLVTLTIKQGQDEAFKALIEQHASASLGEPGCLRFDVFQSQDNPSLYFLVEVYYSEDDLESHRQTPHMARWRERSPELVEKIEGSKYNAIFLSEETSG